MKRFPLTAKNRINFREPIAGGNEPVNKFKARFKVTKFVNLPIEDGTLLDNKFPCRDKALSIDSFDIVEGILPPMLAPKIFNRIILVEEHTIPNQVHTDTSGDP